MQSLIAKNELEGIIGDNEKHWRVSRIVVLTAILGVWALITSQPIADECIIQ